MNRPHFDLCKTIIGGFYEVYNQLGRGFLESVYERSLAITLSAAGLRVQQQFPVIVLFRNELVGRFRADLMVNDAVLIEIKTSKRLHFWHKAQLINVLKATSVEVGLLLNFGHEAEFQRIIYENRRKQRNQLIHVDSCSWRHSPLQL
jgi:GxxExxY protein